MPLDDYSESDEKETEKGIKFFEFDCPVCNANNPYPDGFCPGEEIRCYYCGTEFAVRLSEEGKLKLREL